MPLPRIRRRMRLQSGEDDVDVLRGQRPALHVGPVARVVQERGVQAVEQPVLDHGRLPAPPLLGGRPEEDDLTRQVVRHRGEGDRGPDPRRGHRVVAAPVPETRQRVVLGEDPDPWPARAASAASCGPDRGRQAPGRPLDVEPVAGQDLRDPSGGVVLLERRLRIGMDPVREVEDLGRAASTAAARRDFASTKGSAGRVVVNEGNGALLGGARGGCPAKPSATARLTALSVPRRGSPPRRARARS